MFRVRAAALVAMLLVLGCSSPPVEEHLRIVCGPFGASDAPQTPHFEPKPPAPPALGPDTRDYDQENLALDLDLDMDHGSLTGTATHTMTALADLSQVRMHLVDMTVTSVTSDGGAACTSSQADDVLTIGLDHPRKKGERFTLTIAYGGTPKSGLWFFRPTAEHPDIPVQVWSQGEGEENRHWIPCYDLPDDRLTSSMRVVVPAGLQTLSNGEPTGTETLAGGRVAHTWVLSRPHPSYIITLVAGTFDDVPMDSKPGSVGEAKDGNVVIHNLVPPGWGPWCGEIFGRTPDMMTFFEDYTGQPYAWGRYSQVTVWDFSWGGMENTGATTLNLRALHKDGVRPDYSADGLVAHELAHQWFGDLITCRTFNHIWLNEGFATYFTDLWTEQHDGADEFAVACLGQREGYMNGVDLKATSERKRPDKPTDCGDMAEHQYVKGASVLHMLRKLLGDDVFRAGIRRYMKDNHDQSVETEAFRAALEAESKTDLKWFFDQWVYRSGFPELTVSWWLDRSFKPTPHVKLLVQQTQPISEHMPLFRMPFDVVGPRDDGLPMGEHRVRLELDGKRATQEFDLGACPTENGWTFDPDRWLLARIREPHDLVTLTLRTVADTNVVGRMFACRALAEFGSDSVAVLASVAKSDPNYAVRSEACTALGKIHDESSSAALRAATEDADSRVRRAAMNAMGNCKPEFVAESLKKHLADDPSVYVAADAGAALGKSKAPGAFEALVAGLSRESHRDQIRQRIMDGLKDLADKRGAEVAMRYLDYSWGRGIQHQLRHSAFDAMIALAPEAPETRAWVVKLLDDPYFRMKNWASDAAVKLQIGEALPVMLRLAETATGPGVVDNMKANSGKLRDALVASTPKTAEEERWVRFAKESKVQALDAEKAKLVGGTVPNLQSPIDSR